jgi:hypothetical protein
MSFTADEYCNTSMDLALGAAEIKLHKFVESILVIYRKIGECILMI